MSRSCVSVLLCKGLTALSFQKQLMLNEIKYVATEGEVKKKKKKEADDSFIQKGITPEWSIVH